MYFSSRQDCLTLFVIRSIIVIVSRKTPPPKNYIDYVMMFLVTTTVAVLIDFDIRMESIFNFLSRNLG